MRKLNTTGINSIGKVPLNWKYDAFDVETGKLMNHGLKNEIFTFNAKCHF